MDYDETVLLVGFLIIAIPIIVAMAFDNHAAWRRQIERPERIRKIQERIDRDRAAGLPFHEWGRKRQNTGE